MGEADDLVPAKWRSLFNFLFDGLFDFSEKNPIGDFSASAFDGFIASTFDIFVANISLIHGLIFV